MKVWLNALLITAALGGLVWRLRARSGRTQAVRRSQAVR
jgi:hypothetical protein